MSFRGESAVAFHAEEFFERRPRTASILFIGVLSSERARTSMRNRDAYDVASPSLTSAVKHWGGPAECTGSAGERPASVRNAYAGRFAFSHARRRRAAVVDPAGRLHRGRFTAPMSAPSLYSRRSAPTARF